MLGPREERTRDKVYFEEGGATRVRKSDRAYPIGHTVQSPRKVEAPVASAKVYGELNDFQVKQKQFLKVRRNTLKVEDSYLRLPPQECCYRSLRDLEATRTCEMANRY